MLKKDLELTDKEAQYLINIIKKTISRGSRIVKDGDQGRIDISEAQPKNTKKPQKFIFYYFYALDNIHLQFQDATTNRTLVRINLDSSFHKNSDGKIRGHRVEIFSEKEYYAKNDGQTYVKAFPLPFGIIKDTDDFLVAIKELFDYTNVKDHTSISISSDTSLKI